MPKMTDINKGFIGAWIPLELSAQLRKEAKARKMPNSDLVQYVLQKELDDVELSSEDYKWIAEQVEKNEDKRNERKGQR